MAKFMVCPKCGGAGKIVNPNCSVWTQEDIEQNPDEFESMLDGLYDITCPRCRGERVVENKPAEEQEWEEREQDRRTYLMESGQFE